MLDVQRARAVTVISIFAVGPARVPRWVRWMEHPGRAAGASLALPRIPPLHIFRIDDF